MQLLGTIKTAQELGIKDVPSHKYILAACIDCGKERWVQLVVSKNQPRSPRCRHCAWHRIGKKRTKNQYGRNNPYWRGGEYKTPAGYVMVRAPLHPKANMRGYIRRARLILEEKLGRPILPGYEAHHINEIKDDDRPENLVELSISAHRTLTIKMHPEKVEYMKKFRWPKAVT